MVVGMTPDRTEFESRIGCKRCWGRGYVGVRLDGEPVVCSCAVKVWRQMEKETPVVSVSEDQHERVVDTVRERRIR